jgi:DNA-binding XRE family transcriptional regulator
MYNVCVETSGKKGKTAKRSRHLHFVVPPAKIDDIRKLVIALGGVEEPVEAADAPVLWEEAFPDTHPGMALHGLRVREGLTQKVLAEKLGEKQSHISAMEKGTRSIGKTLAKKIADIFGADYRSFL